MSRMGYYPAIVLSLIVTGTSGFLWGQTSTSQRVPPFASKLKDAIAPADTDSNSARLGNDKTGLESQTEIPRYSMKCDSSCLLCSVAGRSQFVAVGKETPAGDFKAGASGCCEDCPATFCPETSCEGTLDKRTVAYCERMAKLLSVTLQIDESGSDVQQKAIEASLLIVAETIEAKSQAKVKELAAQHLVELATLRMEPAKVSATSATVDQFRKQRNAMPANQIRHNREFQVRNAHASLNRTPNAVKNQTSQKTIEPRRTTNADPGSYSNNRTDSYQAQLRQKENSADLEQARAIQQQINELQKRLQRLQQSSVRPAQHLQPIFTNEQPLKPLYPR